MPMRYGRESVREAILPRILAGECYFCIGMLRYATLIAPKLTIQGGTREILRGIVARGLGLR